MDRVLEEVSNQTLAGDYVQIVTGDSSLDLTYLGENLFASIGDDEIVYIDLIDDQWQAAVTSRPDQIDESDEEEMLAAVFDYYNDVVGDYIPTIPLWDIPTDLFIYSL